MYESRADNRQATDHFTIDFKSGVTIEIKA